MYPFISNDSESKAVCLCVSFNFIHVTKYFHHNKTNDYKYFDFYIRLLILYLQLAIGLPNLKTHYKLICKSRADSLNVGDRSSITNRKWATIRK